MAEGAFSKRARDLINEKGSVTSLTSSGNPGVRGMYPAIVLSTDDPTGQNRVIARIINIDNEGKVVGGKDRDTPDALLPFAVPLIPEFLHVRPLVGEMVIIFLENPNDLSSPRYWVGPLISNQLKLKYQSFQDANKIFDYTQFTRDPSLNNNLEVFNLIPQQGDIAIQGRQDADLILKPREVILSAGKFKINELSPNTESPCSIQLKQITLSGLTGANREISQTNIKSNNINIYSPFGKFRQGSLGNTEINENLKDYGDLANQLHPTVFGDELVILLDLIIKVLLTHIHTPQTQLVPIPESIELQKYTIQGNLQNILSNVVRIN